MPQKRRLAGLSLMPDPLFADAVRPLFEIGAVDVVEWSFDICWDAPLSPWVERTLGGFSTQDRLLGHGVTFSPLSAGWRERDAAWIDRFQRELHRRQYRHVSEHFGFCRGGDFHHCAPLPVPLSRAALSAGQNRLRQLADAAELPIGLENLAFAFGPDDVARQGEFLDRLLEQVDGFLVLDLHNLYCQAVNFNAPAEELLQRYPLQRVRELHLSGGSFDDRDVRRDTHDGPVPAEVWRLLETALAQCPSTEFVILERLGHSLAGTEANAFRAEFLRLRAVLDRDTDHTDTNRSRVPAMELSDGESDAALEQYQAGLLANLAGRGTTTVGAHQLADDPDLHPYRDSVERFDPRMVDVAADLVRKWGRR